MFLLTVNNAKAQLKQGTGVAHNIYMSTTGLGIGRYRM